ncbi:MAG TPA: hypothetical protein VFH45_00385 [Acidimicrobiales bacterium]|nr:hypothetical protein [Acidimicrobiales bacterium]
MRRLATSLGALAAVTCIEVALIGGVPALSGLPGPWHPGALVRSVAAGDATTAAVALVWAVAMVAGAWLLAGVVLSLLACLPGLAPVFGRPLPRWVLPVSVQLLLGLAGSTAMSACGTGPAAGAGAAGATATIFHLLDGRGPSAVASGPGAAEAPAAGLPSIWTVGEGESFWTIAEAAWRRAYGVEPAPHDLAGYWLRVVGANRGRLVRPGDADLLMPGQALVLPPLPGTAGAEASGG